MNFNQIKTPQDVLTFQAERRQQLFAKFPKPSNGGARGTWKNLGQHARNAMEDGYFNPEAAQQMAKKIEDCLS